ncbi:MAG: DUF975 family protein [Streptococcaceae bacterium]|jgi:uncharacterized membrane protein|nr:DUF975 family protein [Streptococcaceae bacterium]
MTSSELKNAARYALKENFIQKMLLLIVPIVLSIFSVGFNITNQKQADLNLSSADPLSNIDLVALLTIVLPIILIVSFLLTIVITIFKTAAIFNYIDIFRDEKDEINLLPDILRTFRDQSFKKIILLTLLTQVILGILVFIPIIGWAVGIYLSFSWSQASYVLYDKLKNNEYQGIWDVLNTSKELMKGYKFKYFIFNLSFIGWYLLNGLFFGLPQFWVMPYTQMSMVAFYQARLQDRL